LYHTKYKPNKKIYLPELIGIYLKKDYIKIYVKEILLPYVLDVELGTMSLVKVNGFFHFFIKKRWVPQAR